MNYLIKKFSTNKLKKFMKWKKNQNDSINSKKDFIIFKKRNLLYKSTKFKFNKKLKKSKKEFYFKKNKYKTGSKFFASKKEIKLMKKTKKFKKLKSSNEENFKNYKIKSKKTNDQSKLFDKYFNSKYLMFSFKTKSFHSKNFNSSFCRKFSLKNHFTISCLFILILQFLIGNQYNSTVFASVTCLNHCNCIYFKNKFQADCSSLSLENLPIVKDEALASKVQVLNLTRNSFINLEDEIFYTAKMINLQRIYLSKGVLQTIGNSSFYRLNNLVELDLSQNRLVIVPKVSFQHIFKLTILDLSFNYIQSLTEFSFYPLKMLKILSLENNQISTINPKAFFGLIELETLKLSDNHLNYLSSESLSPLNKLHTITLANNKWQCDCKMRQLKEFLILNSRINVLDQPACDNHSKNIWTETSVDSFLCTPKLIYNNSERVYQVGQGSNLVLECSFQVESTLDSQPAVIRWLWQNRPITNNSEGVVNSQKFIITEYDYYLTTETTLAPYSNNFNLKNITPNITSKQKSIKNNLYSDFVESEDEDDLPLIELHDLNQFHSLSKKVNQKNNALNIDQQIDSFQQRSTLNPSLNQFNEKHIVKRRIRKSRIEITFILELNQGTYWCEASNQAGSVSLNFTVYVNSVIRRTDFIANNKIAPIDSSTISSDLNNSLLNKQSELDKIAAGSEDNLVAYNELNAADQTTSQNKLQPFLNTSNSVVVGLILGILFGILLVLAIFSVLIVALCRKKTDQVDLMSAAVAIVGNNNSCGQTSSASTGCSTENSLLSSLALAQVNCLQNNNLQTNTINHSTLPCAGGNFNEWYTNENNYSSNSSNHFNNIDNYNLYSNNRNSQNYNNPLSIALPTVHHSGSINQINGTNNLSMLNSADLFTHCNLLTSPDQLLNNQQMTSHTVHLASQTGGNHSETLSLLNVDDSTEKCDFNPSTLQILNEDLVKSKIV